VNKPGLINNYRLLLTSSVSQFNLTDPTAIFKNLMHPKHVVNLTLNNKEDDGGNDNAIKISWLRNT
jgi:hypothetical protein